MKFLILLLLFAVTAQAGEKMSIYQIRFASEKFFEENPKEALKDYDTLELDLLYQDLEKLTLFELSRKYPELTVQELEELKTKRK